MIIERVAVVGLGKVGELVARLLARSGFTVDGFDAAARSVAELPFECRRLDVTDEVALRAALRRHDAVVTALPYYLNRSVATAAHVVGVHYFDLTEDVPTTDYVQQLAREGSDVVLAPQCGLAPGLIGIIGAHLAGELTDVASLELKVGALPQNPVGLLGYAFNWSPAGVVNEYLNDCAVLRGGVRKLVPAMTELERVVIGGNVLEAALTSGGLGTMCETFERRIQRLDYKTLRYPGHFTQMRFFFDELGMRDRRELAGEILVRAKPPVEQDVVYLHAAANGRLPADAPYAPGQPMRKEYVRAYLPRQIDGRDWRAISWTTAASVVAVVELVGTGILPPRGFIAQERIDLDAFLQTPTGSYFADQSTP